MHLLQHIKIGTKIYLLVGVFLLLSILLASYGMSRIKHLGNEIEELSAQDIPILYNLTQITLLHEEREQGLQRAMRLGMQTPGTDKTALEFQSARKRIDEQTAKLELLIRQGKELTQKTLTSFTGTEQALEMQKTLDHLNTVNEGFRLYAKSSGEILDAVALKNHNQALTLLREREAAHNDLEWELKNFLENMEIFTENAVHKVAEDERSTFLGMQLLIVLGLSVGTLLSYLLARMISRPLISLSETMRAVAQSGDYSQRVAVSGSDEVAMAGASFNHLAQKTYEQYWLKSGLSRLNGVLQAATTPEELARRLLRETLEITGSLCGAVYLLEESSATFRLSTHSGGVSAPLSDFHENEGIPGRAAAEHTVLAVQDIPPDFARIRSSLGESLPTAIVAMPMVFKGVTLGVLEMASFRPFSLLEVELLESLAPSAGMSLQQVQQAKATRLLLEQTQRQAEELEHQQDELRQANAHLEEQAHALKASEEELTAQNEELEENKDELQRQNAELESIQKELEEQVERVALASRYKSEFLANMSHELRTPLNSLLLLSRNLAGNPDNNLTQEQLKTAQIIHNSGQDLLRLVNDILDLAKVEAGRMEVQAAPVELKAFASELHQLFLPLAQERKLRFEAVVQEDAPAALHTDGRRLKQILQNLLSNAFKFTPNGAVTLTVRPESASGARLAFCVQDSGIGIPRDKRELIFDAFQQGDGAITRKYGGTGLGLTISRGLARLLGGELRLESTEGQGSTFTLLLPTGEAAPDRPAPLPPLRETPDEARPPFIPDDREKLSPGDGHLLVIEDDPVFAAEVGRIAHVRGVRFVATDRGAEGVALARRLKPRGIILDLGLPDMDGFKVREALAEIPETREIPIHVVSARDPDTQEHATNVIGHLVKPAGPEGISQAIHRLESASSGPTRRALLVTGEEGVQTEIEPLLEKNGVAMVRIDAWSQVGERLTNEPWSCVILHVARGSTALETLPLEAFHDAGTLPPLILYTDEPLSGELHRRARRMTDSVIVRSERSLDRLRADILLFLHSVQRSGKGELPLSAMALPPHGDDLFKDKVVLVVDDDVRNAYALAKTLKEKGIKVLMAPDGQKALEMLERERRIDAVLMDVMMPGMDGYQAIRSIRADPRFKALPILVLTAKAMPGDREDALIAGANDYLAKPIDEARLFALLRVWLYSSAWKQA